MNWNSDTFKPGLCISFVAKVGNEHIKEIACIIGCCIRGTMNLGYNYGYKIGRGNKITERHVQFEGL